MILKEIGVFSVARLFGGMYACFGLIVGFFFSFVSVVGSFAAFSGANVNQAGGPVLGMLLGVGAVIFLPAFYGILGFLGGALGAALFNLMSRVFGGIEMTFVNAPGAPPPPAVTVQWPEKS